MRDRPLLWSAASFAAGILLPLPDLPAERWAACASAALTGALLLCVAARSPRSHRDAALWLVVGFVCAGRLSSAACAIREPFDIAVLLERHPGPFSRGAELRGRLAGPSRLRGDGILELLLDLDRVTLGTARLPARGRVRLRVPAPEGGSDEAAAWARGARVVAFARVTQPRRYGNEGAFDYARYLRSRGIEATGHVKSTRLIESLETGPVGLSVRLMRGVDRLRRGILDRIERSFERDPAGRRAGAVAAALLLGERDRITLEDESLLQEAGLSHLLAVSGFNVAVLAVALLIACRCGGLSARASSLAVIPCLCVYLLLNREESSVERAVVMAVSALAARAVWRRPDPLNIVGLSALAILVCSPLQAFDAGFQLTYAATLSLVVLVPRLMGDRRPSRGFLHRPVRWVNSAAMVSLAAWAGTFPIAALDFNRVTPGALPANIVAGPLMAAAFLGALALPIACFVPGSLPCALAGIVTHLVDLTFRCAEMVRIAPFLSYRRATPGLPALVLFYAGLGAFLAWRGEGAPRRLARRVACAVAAGSAVILLLPFDTRAVPRGLRVTAFDVGQGDAILVETAAGARVLVDAGPLVRGEFDAGERVVSPALWRLGIARIDRLVVTHADADHAGGAAAIVGNFAPKEVWMPHGAAAWPDSPALARLRRAIAARRIPVRLLAEGDAICLRGACVSVVSPARGGRAPAPANEGSLVLRIGWGGRSILLPGDASRYEENPGAAARVVDILKVSHHGSATATSARFCDASRPRVAVISCGPLNRFGHPDPRVVGNLVAAGARVCRTDRDGAISVELLAGRGGATLLGEPCALRGRPPLRSEVAAGERTGHEADDEHEQRHHRHGDPPLREPVGRVEDGGMSGAEYRQQSRKEEPPGKDEHSHQDEPREAHP